MLVPGKEWMARSTGPSGVDASSPHPSFGSQAVRWATIFRYRASGSASGRPESIAPEECSTVVAGSDGTFDSRLIGASIAPGSNPATR